jgi:hypothetical protein
LTKIIIIGRFDPFPGFVQRFALEVQTLQEENFFVCLVVVPRLPCQVCPMSSRQADRKFEPCGFQNFADRRKSSDQKCQPQDLQSFNHQIFYSRDPDSDNPLHTSSRCDSLTKHFSSLSTLFLFPSNRSNCAPCLYTLSTMSPIASASSATKLQKESTTARLTGAGT